MVYCNQCGNAVQADDVFCARCGARQPVREAPTSDPFSGISPRTASMLCYVPMVGWVASIIILAADRFRNNRAVRFHAFQGLYLFVAWLIVTQVVAPVFEALPGPHFHAVRILEAAMVFTWIFMMVQANHERPYSLPIIGELAEKSAAHR